MQITIVYNARPENIDRSDPRLEKFIEGDEWKTIEAIGKAIMANGYEVSYIKVDDDLYQNLSETKDKTDLIFNLAEGVAHLKDREAQLPMLAEILRIPHTGPSPLESALILDKYRAKQIWRAEGVMTAESQLFNSPMTLLQQGMKFPLLVKPNSDGSGVGIHETSVVNNETELRAVVQKILSEYKQGALVETYLPGREFTVAIVGNGGDLTVLPIVEINFDGLPKDAPAIDSYKAKFIYGATGMVPMDKTEFCPAKISKELEEQIIDLAKRAYTSIGCQDFGRIDIRLDESGKPHVLEINHPPGLMSDPDESSFFTISARTYGWDFNTLIGKILKSAIERLRI
jgi:D-alanine-D-alanine ligase